MSYFKLRKAAGRLLLTAFAMTLLSACTTTYQTTSVEDRLHHEKVEERANRRDLPIMIHGVFN